MDAKGRQVSELWIYPVKSLGGIHVSRSKVMPKGLEHDRRWMLVDAESVFMTQRVHPKMALFRLSLDHDTLMVRYRDEMIPIPLGAESGRFAARIWDDIVEVAPMGKRYDQWFSEMLGMHCRLVFFPENWGREIDPSFNGKDAHVSLADAFPLLIIGQSSLDDLNERLRVPVPMNRFRPNIVFTGGAPFEEDQWRAFKVGRNRFSGARPCSRCTLTTVDQETGMKGTEPLATLSTYRKTDGHVNFGLNIIPIDHDEIFVGDAIGPW